MIYLGGVFVGWIYVFFKFSSANFEKHFLKCVFWEAKRLRCLRKQVLKFLKGWWEFGRLVQQRFYLFKCPECPWMHRNSSTWLSNAVILHLLFLAIKKLLIPKLLILSSLSSPKMFIDCCLIKQLSKNSQCKIDVIFSVRAVPLYQLEHLICFILWCPIRWQEIHPMYNVLCKILQQKLCLKKTTQNAAQWISISV